MDIHFGLLGVKFLCLTFDIFDFLIQKSKDPLLEHTKSGSRNVKYPKQKIKEEEEEIYEIYEKIEDCCGCEL